MRIHHLNCGTHCPLGGAIFDGVSRGLLASIPTHCLLIETERGLVLVDTGYGMQDVPRPHGRLSRIWPALLNVRLRKQETALRQIEARDSRRSAIAACCRSRQSSRSCAYAGCIADWGKTTCLGRQLWSMLPARHAAIAT
jgi:hypothetical protein